MQVDIAKADLKRCLRREVAKFCERDNLVWKRPIIDTLRDLQKVGVEAVFFGGTLRSLLVSRVFHGKPGRPRDIDIVVSGASVDTLKTHFKEFVSRETRFGGLQLNRRGWQFDVWPLGKTWAFMRDAVAVPSFAALPSTTFFNLEAIAVEVWPRQGRARQIYSGDDQFFDGILSKTLEINLEENPYPELCVLRALIMSAELDFCVGSRLARYIARHGSNLTPVDLDDLQQKHYGQKRATGETLRQWIEAISELYQSDTSVPITLPIPRQLSLSPEQAAGGYVRVHAMPG